MTVTATDATDTWLTPEQVGAHLQVSTSTIYRLITNGELPAVQLGGPRSTLRISRRELDAWLRGETP